MKNDNLISVIIPVYNAMDTLAGTVASVLSQDFDHLEVILVDDGSTDSSGMMCDEIAASDRRVRVLHKSNGGVSSARNAGIDAASGTYVMFMDADDFLNEGALSSMYVDDVDFVVAGFEKVADGKRQVFVPEISCLYDGKDRLCAFFDSLIKDDECYILNSPCFKLFRLDVIRENRLAFVEDLSYAEDKIFVMSFLLHANSVRTVAETVYRYVIRGGSLSSDMCSDAHIHQVFLLLGEYTPLLSKLESRYPGSRMLRRLYHMDVVSRYVCRILTSLAVRSSGMLNEENVSRLYAYMDADKDLGVFSVRTGQIINILLYKLHNPSFTCAFYKFTASVCERFRTLVS